MVVILIFIIAGGIVTIFAAELISQLKEDVDIETCRLSVLGQSATRKVPGTDISGPKTIIPLECQRRIVDISENEVNVYGKKSSYKIKNADEGDVNKILAEELRLCWYKMAEGKVDIFEDDFIRTSGGRVCLVCSEVNFDIRTKKEFSGLVNYLKLNKVPNADNTYYTYLSNSQKTRYLAGGVPWTQWFPFTKEGKTTEKIDQLENGKISTRGKYLIYFMAFKPSVIEQATGALSQVYYIGIMKGNEAQTKCDQLVN